MSKPFEYRDFSKRYSDLSTNNFPSLNKEKQLENNIKFKFSSKAQNGVRLDSSVNNKNRESTDSEFGVKLNFDDLKGVELGFKAKSKPATEFTLRFDDKLIPLEGSSFTLKTLASGPGEQSVSGTFGYGNKHVTLNLGLGVPVNTPYFSFVTKQEDLDKQRTKIDFDFVARPLEQYDVFVGSQVNTELARSGNETDQLLYKSQLTVGFNNKTTNAGVSLTHNKELSKEEYKHSTSYGGWVFTEVDDLSGGARVSYNPSKSEENGKGFEFELVGGLQRDSDSKLSSKVTVVPNTTVSLGYEQRLSKNTKLSFGYAFLLNTTNTSAYSFGVEFSH